MKKRVTKLGIKKVTLRDLDDPALAAMAGGTTGDTCNEPATCVCPTTKVGTCGLCKLSKASCDGTCFGTACI
jgi:hypothetical protein